MSNLALQIEPEFCISDYNLKWNNVRDKVKMRRLTLTDIEMEILEMVAQAGNNLDSIAQYVYCDEDFGPSTVKRCRMNLNNLKKKLNGHIKEHEGKYYLVGF